MICRKGEASRKQRKKLADAKKSLYYTFRNLIGDSSVAKCTTKEIWRKNEDKKQEGHHNVFICAQMIYLTHVVDYMGSQPQDKINRQNKLEDDIRRHRQGDRTTDRRVDRSRKRQERRQPHSQPQSRSGSDQDSMPDTHQSRRLGGV